MHIAIFEAKYDPPVAGNRDAPPSLKVTSERMKSIPRQINVARLAGFIKVCQGKHNPLRLVSTHPTGIAPLI